MIPTNLQTTPTTNNTKFRDIWLGLHRVNPRRIGRKRSSVHTYLDWKVLSFHMMDVLQEER